MATRRRRRALTDSERAEKRAAERELMNRTEELARRARQQGSPWSTIWSLTKAARAMACADNADR